MYTPTLLARIKKRLLHSLDRWQLPADTQIELLTTSENATFLAHAPRSGQKTVIRVHRPDYHTREEIESELAWIADLRAQHQVTTPAPLETDTASPVIQLEPGSRRFHAVAFEYVEGHAPQVGEALPSRFEELGALTASLHTHSKAWQPPVGFARKRWHLDTMIGPNGLWGDWRQAPDITGADETLIDQAVEQIHRFIDDYGQDQHRFGLVHADLRLDNLLVAGDELAVIDFDDCGFCWYAFDFAASISFFELDPLIPTLREAWIRGYRSVAAFDEYDVAALDTFIMIRRIMLSAWLATHGESPTARELSDGFIQGTAMLARAYTSASRETPSRSSIAME